MEASVMFMDCPAYLDEEGTARCGLPAQVRYRFTMQSTDGPLESAMIRCPVGHWFNGPIEALTWDSDRSVAHETHQQLSSDIGRLKGTRRAGGESP